MDSSQKEIKKLLENINFMFPNVHGFLLPHPGIDVTQKEFSGNVKSKLYEVCSKNIAISLLLYQIIKNSISGIYSSSYM